MRRNTLLVDAALAVAVAALVLILAPGLAVVAMIVLLVLLICGISLIVELRRTNPRRARHAKRAPPR